MAEIIDISNLNETSSSNFGGGVELLMNKSHSDKQGNANIDLSDLNDLERELNDLKGDDDYQGSSGRNGGGGVSFNDTALGDDDVSVHLNINDEDNDVPLDLGSATSNMGSGQTWDNYGKYGEMPSTSAPSSNYASSNNNPMSKNDQEKLQYSMIRKLEEMERKSKGKLQLLKKYTMESPFNEVKNEYDAIMEDTAKKSSVKFQAGCMKMLINGVEYLNNKFDPCDINLDGWGDQVDENIDDYDDIFGELYDKYQSRGNIAPELKLLFQLGGSAFMVNLSNKIFKTAAPGMDDIFRQNPELMRSFQNAAVNTMGQNNPGIGNFMSGITNQGANQKSNQGQGQGQRPGGPPPPMPTQGQYAEPPPLNRGGNNNRPDLAAARGVQARNAPQPVGRDRERMPPGPRNVAPSQQHMANNSAMNLALGEPQERSERKARPEMRGPSDVSNLLSGMKTRTINVAPEQQTQAHDDDNMSQISGDSNSVTPSMAKKKPRKPRKSKSDKNTVSMDL